MAIRCEEGAYRFVRVTVTDDGFGLDYQIDVDGAPQGADFIDTDNDLFELTDDEVRDDVAEWLGIIEGKDEIEVVHD